MEKAIRIVTPEGDGNSRLISGHRTKILTEDGSEVYGVRSVDISIRPDDVVRAEISIFLSGVDVLAHPLLSLETVEAAAKAHGYRLVREAGTG